MSQGMSPGRRSPAHRASGDSVNRSNTVNTVSVPSMSLPRTSTGSVHVQRRNLKAITNCQRPNGWAIIVAPGLDRQRISFAAI